MKTVVELILKIGVNTIRWIYSLWIGIGAFVNAVLNLRFSEIMELVSYLVS